MRLVAAALAGAALLASAATAQAAQRYAAPNGSGPAAECPRANPCSLKDAIEKAKENDEVIVGAGSYTVGGPIISQFEAANLDLHGDFGAPMPRITGSFIGTVLGINGAKSRISYLEVVNEGPENPSGINCSTEGLVERVVARASGKRATALFQQNGCTARNSLLLAGGQEAIALWASSFAPGLNGIARNVTAIAGGPESSGVLARYEAIFLTHGTYTLDLKNSIAAGGGAGIRTSNGLEGPGNVVVANSNFDTAKEEIGTEVVNAGGNQTAPPLFVDAANGDYREAAGSPTIDAGAADPLIGGLDLGGGPRTLGPAPDIGAYETTNPPPPAPLAGAIQSLAVAPKAFRAAKTGGAIVSKKKTGAAPVGAKVTYSLSGKANAEFMVERKTVGRSVKGKCVKQTKANAAKKRCAILKPVNPAFAQAAQAGQNSFRFSGRLGNKPLRPGAYRLLGSVGGAVKQASFKIVK
jgi:hypothetical protein